MIDVFNIPNSDLKTQIFYTTASGATNQWQTWSKPANAKMIYFTVIGGGAGGAGGFASVGTRNGGAGGGGSSLTIGLFPASVLPDTLYIQVGAGGAGSTGTPTGTATNPLSGNSGSLSYVSISASTDNANVILASGTVAARGGAGGTSGTGGAGGTAFSDNNSIIAKIGIVYSIAGQAGGNSGAGAVGNSITVTNLPITGGAGGGGATSSLSYSGGSINSFAFLPTLFGGISGSTGSNGFDSKIFNNNNTSIDNILLLTGGAGGGGASGITGGNGGNGAYGSGGGGGGAGSNASPFSGGTGGNGGNGIVIITCI